MAVAADAGLVAQRLLQRLAEADADVFDRVVLIDVEVALGLDRQSIARASPKRQHVVEKADARGDIGWPEPSRLSVSSMLVSAVLRELAVRAMELLGAMGSRLPINRSTRQP